MKKMVFCIGDDTCVNVILNRSCLHSFAHTSSFPYLRRKHRWTIAIWALEHSYKLINRQFYISIRPIECFPGTLNAKTRFRIPYTFQGRIYTYTRFVKTTVIVFLFFFFFFLHCSSLWSVVGKYSDKTMNPR